MTPRDEVRPVSRCHREVIRGGYVEPCDRPVRIGSMFSGYEGIGLALREVFGEVEHVFVADVCKHTKAKDGIGRAHV